MPRVLPPTPTQAKTLSVTAAASRLASAFRPVASSSSLPASAPQAAGVVVAAVQSAFPQKEGCAVSEAANARSAGEFAAAEQTHPGWEPADYSVARSAYGSFPADCLAALSAYDSLRADLVPDGWVPVEC